MLTAYNKTMQVRDCNKMRTIGTFYYFPFMYGFYFFKLTSCYVIVIFNISYGLNIIKNEKNTKI